MTKLVEEVAKIISDEAGGPIDDEGAARAAIAKVFDWLDDKSCNWPYGPTFWLKQARKEALGEK